MNPLQPPLFEADPPTYFANGMPKEVYVTPARRGGYLYDEIAVFRDIARALRSELMRVIRVYRPGITNETMRHFSGILQMNNLTDNRHAHAEILQMNELDMAAVQVRSEAN